MLAFEQERGGREQGLTALAVREAGVAFELTRGEARADRFKLALEARETSSGLTAEIRYDPGLFDPADVACLVVGGVVVVEAVFNYPGIGTLMLDAVHNRDVPVLQFIAVLGALVYVVSNLLADIAATALNPRLRTPARAR